MPRFRSRRFLFLAATAFLSCCFFIVGCATMPSFTGYAEDFERAQPEYTQMVRWGSFEKAAGWVETESVETFLQKSANAADIRFTDYAVLRKDLDHENWTAQVTVRYEVHRANELISTNVLEKQTWEFDKTENRWAVNTNLFEAIEAAFPK